MGTGAQDAAIGTTRDELAAYLRHHEARYPRAEQLRVHVDYGDLCDWRAALDAAEARQAVLVAAFKLIGPALVGYDGFKTVWCTPCDREIGPIPECCADCPHGEHCPLALYDALTASPAPGGVAGEERNA